MKGDQPQKVQREPDIANLDQSELVSNQQEKVVPYFAGERRLAGTAFTPVYNLHSKPSKDTPGKK